MLHVTFYDLSAIHKDRLATSTKGAKLSPKSLAEIEGKLVVIVT